MCITNFIEWMYMQLQRNCVKIQSYSSFALHHLAELSDHCGTTLGHEYKSACHRKKKWRLWGQNHDCFASYWWNWHLLFVTWLGQIPKKAPFQQFMLLVVPTAKFTWTCKLCRKAARGCIDCLLYSCLILALWQLTSLLSSAINCSFISVFVSFIDLSNSLLLRNYREQKEVKINIIVQYPYAHWKRAGLLIFVHNKTL